MAIILGIGQLITPHRDSRNYTAASLLFCLGSIHLITYSQAVGLFSALPFLVAVQIPLFTLLGPVFYLYFMRVLDTDFTLSARHALHFLPTLVTIPILLPYLLKSLEEKELVHLRYAMEHVPLWQQFPNNLVVVIFITTLIYVLYPLKTIAPLLRRKLLLRNPSTLVVLGFILCFSINIICVIVYQFDESFALETAVAIFFTCWIIAIYLVNQRYPAFLSTVTETIAQAKYQKSQLGNVDVEQVLSQLEQLIQVKKVYLDEDLSLPTLADQLGINAHQLSEILNRNLNTSFKKYIKKNRIEEAKKLLLTDPTQTVLTISMEVGFRSSSTFNAAFRQETGLSPIEYRKTHLPPQS